MIQTRSRARRGVVLANSFIPTPSTAHPANAPPGFPLQAPTSPMTTLPFISFSDKVVIPDVRGDVRSLNSSICDLVASLIRRHRLANRVIWPAKGAEKDGLSPLVQVVLGYAGMNIVLESRRYLYESVILDIVNDFIFDCVQGKQTGKFGKEYSDLCTWTERMEQTEKSPEGRHWRYQFVDIVDPPPATTWNELAQDLITEINGQLGMFFTPPTASGVYIKSDPIVGLVSQVIQMAYTLMMKMKGGVLSQTLQLTLGTKKKGADPSEIEMGRGLPLDCPNGMHRLNGLDDSEYVVLGNRSFGLAGLSEHGREIHLKPLITAGCVRRE